MSELTEAQTTSGTSTHGDDSAVVGEPAVEAFMERVLGDYAGANAFFMGAIGDRLGLFADLTAAGPATSSELAQRTGLDERYLREWLGGMAAAEYRHYDPVTMRYALPADHAPVLSEEAGPWFLAAAMFDVSTNFGDSFHHLLDAFRSGQGITQETHGPEVAHSIDRFTAPWYENLLVPVWLPAMPAVLSRLEAGAMVCDVGCGQGRALVKLAEAFQSCTCIGFDTYGPAVDRATQRAQQAGLQDRVRFEVRDVARGLPDRYDVITTFDVVHDSVDPQGLLTAIHNALMPDGRYLCLDINCGDRPEDNVGPLGTVLYGLSLAYCLPVSRATRGEGLGTVGLPESKLREIGTDAGFTAIERAPIDDPFSALYVLTP